MERFKATGEVPRSWLAVMMNAVKFRALDLIKSPTVKHAGFSMDEDDSTFEPAVAGDFTVGHAESGPARAALETLEDAQQREVLYLLYYEDKTQAQAAKELGLSPGRITQIKQAALKKVAANIDEYLRR